MERINNFNKYFEKSNLDDNMKKLLDRANEIIEEYKNDSFFIEGEDLTINTAEEAIELLSQIDPTHPLADEAEEIYNEIELLMGGEKPDYPFPSHGIS